MDDHDHGRLVLKFSWPDSEREVAGSQLTHYDIRTIGMIIPVPASDGGTPMDRFLFDRWLREHEVEMPYPENRWG